MPYSEYNEKMCPEKKDTSRDFARLVCKLNPLRKRIRAQRCYRHFRCVSKRKADDFNVSLSKSVVAQALQIPLKHLSSNRLEFQSLTSQSGCSFDMFKNLRREDIMKHPCTRWGWLQTFILHVGTNRRSFHELAASCLSCNSGDTEGWILLGNQVEIWLGVSTKETCESTRILLWGLRDWRIHRDRWTHHFACGSREEFW